MDQDGVRGKGDNAYGARMNGRVNPLTLGGGVAKMGENEIGVGSIEEDPEVVEMK